MTDYDWLQVEHVGIKVDGTYIADDIMNMLLLVEVDTTFEMPSMFTFTFRDDDLDIVERGPFDIGKAVEITFVNQSTDRLTSLMKGEITAIEPNYAQDYVAQYIVRGYDRSHRLNRATQTKAYINQSESDIAKTLGGDAGLSVVADDTTTVHENLLQHSQTNLSFLHQLARLNGFEIYVDDRTLHFKKAKTKLGGTLTLAWGSTLRSFRPRLSTAGQVNEVTVRGWDPKTKKAIIGKATSSSAHPTIGAASSSGGALAKSKFGDAKHIEVRRPVATQQHANAVAQAILDEINAGFVQAEGVADGSPMLVAGAEVTLQNLGSKFNGTYLVTSARHIYEPGSYHIDFTVSGNRPQSMSSLLLGDSASVNDVPSWGGVYPALVTNINDPDNKGRVKLQYPWLDDQAETGWARVMFVGAGKDRGLVWLPEVGDEVLVMFEQGDFNYPIVIGGLHNGKDNTPQADAAQNGKVEVRMLKTRAGHVIRLTDKAGEEKIEIIDSKQNTSVVMDTANKKITVTTKDKFQLDATGDVTINVGGNATVSVKGNAEIKAQGNMNLEATQNMTVKGMNVTIQATSALKLQGGTVNMQSDATMDIKANAIMNVQSSAVLNVKGSLLNLN
jgi:uncharacterized protein involved in type VI secretion and phage assembly